MDTGVSNISHPSTIAPQLMFHHKAETEDLRESLTKFIREAPNDERLFTDAQLETAKELKREVLKLYTPEKLFELHKIISRQDKHVDEGIPKIINCIKERVSMLIALQAFYSLACWKEKKSNTDILEFINIIIKAKEIFWGPAPELPSAGMEALLAKVVLHMLLEKETHLELLQEVKSEILQDNLQKHIDNEKDLIERKRKEINIFKPMSKDVFLVGRFEEDALRKKNENENEYDFDQDRLRTNVEIKIDVVNKKEKAIGFLNAFNSFLEDGKTKELQKALIGAGIYLDHLVDEEKKINPEGNPENKIIYSYPDKKLKETLTKKENEEKNEKSEKDAAFRSNDPSENTLSAPSKRHDNNSSKPSEFAPLSKDENFVSSGEKSQSEIANEKSKKKEESNPLQKLLPSFIYGEESGDDEECSIQ